MARPECLVHVKDVPELIPNLHAYMSLEISCFDPVSADRCKLRVVSSALKGRPADSAITSSSNNGRNTVNHHGCSAMNCPDEAPSAVTSILLALPFEIRLTIYNHLFRNTPHYLSGSPIICRLPADRVSSSSAQSQFNYGGYKLPPRTKLRACAAIILSCRQVYHEALPIYYRQAWVYCTYKYAITDLMSLNHFAVQRKHIKRLFGISMVLPDSMSMIVKSFPSLEVLGLREDQPIPVPRSGPMTYDIDTVQVVIRAKQQQQHLPRGNELVAITGTEHGHGTNGKPTIRRKPLKVIKKVIVEAGLVAGSILHACYVVDLELETAWLAWRHICSTSVMRSQECAFTNDPWYHSFYHTTDEELRMELAVKTIGFH